MAAKIFTFGIILVGLSLLLGFAGIPTGMGKILTEMGLMTNGIYDSTNLANFQSSNLYAAIAAIFTVIAVATIIVGFFTRQSTDSILVAGLSALFLTFVADLISIIKYANASNYSSWVTILITLIFVPLILGYFISVIDFWRGSD